MASTKYPVIKVILCGEYGVGKSSLFRRFVYDSFSEDSGRNSTLGFDHFEKLYQVEGKEIMIQLWDTGGLERVASITSNYFKYAEAALLVFAHDASESFNMLSHHMLEILSQAENARIFLVGNKSDLASFEHGPSDSQIEAFHREYALSDNDNLIRRVYLTSCKSRQGVHEMFQDIAAVLARSVRTEPDPDPDHFKLKPRPEGAGAQGGCCGGAGGESGSASAAGTPVVARPAAASPGWNN